ncbi:ABC transporter substrate-binding protein [Aeromicrobium flavum]|uniref:ABC transporter substrate-binding protein n=2 Tax=Aeromicrobium flavum TaxID=416568 RepID=A0A512HXK7_9ACTN|nr:ABC transporter substrate-binding protein [Aeromicrobium flavum]
MLKALGALGLAGASAAVLPAFGTPDRRQDPASCAAQDLSASDPRLVFSNWPEYIDEEGENGEPSTLQQFEKLTGISVSYVPDVNDNTEFFAKVVNQLGACQSTKRDMFALTDWMAARMIQMGWIQPMDRANVPNLHANLIDSLRGVGWDAERDYSAPWQSGLTGICYNKRLVPEVRTMDELLTRSDLRGRVTLLTEMRDTMGLTLLSDGADPADFAKDDWDTALEKVKKARRAGQIRAFTGNDYVQDLEAGNIAACVAWSGDVIATGNEDLVFVTPEEGLMIWSDNMIIPNLATHQANAEKFVDFYYQPEIAAQLAAYVNYICPVKGAQDAMLEIDPELAESQLIFPTDETLSQTHGFMALSESVMRTYEGEFADVAGS